MPYACYDVASSGKMARDMAPDESMGASDEYGRCSHQCALRQRINSPTADALAGGETQSDSS